MESITGLMGVFIEEISSKECVTAMEYGRIKKRFIKVATEWIKNKALVFINGKISKSTKVNSDRTIVMDTGSSSIWAKRINRS